MKALLIQHKKAGGGRTSTKSIVKSLESEGWKVRRIERDDVDAKAIRSAGAKLIVVAGGDGTVADILSMLPDRSVPVAIVPTGTANNIARSLGFAGKAPDMIKRWDLERRTRFDIGNAWGPWGCTPFAEAVGFGAFAESLRLAPHVEGLRRLRAGREALIEALGCAAVLSLEIEVDGTRLPADLLMVEILNIALTGPRLALAPGADPGDGRLDIAYLREGGRDALCAWLGGRRRAGAPVERIGGREIFVRGGGVRMRIDDASCGLDPKSEVTIRLEGEPVQILAPPGRPSLAG